MKQLICTLTLFFGGSVILLLCTLSGCTQERYITVFQDIRTEGYQGLSAPVILEHGDSTRTDNFYMEVYFDFNILDQVATLPTGNRVYAQGNREAENRNLEALSTFRIYPVQDYNADFPAGSDMSDQCLFYEFPSGVFSNTPLKALEALNRQATKWRSQEHELYLKLKLQAFPDQAGYNQFVIEFETIQNTLLRDTSLLFYLIP